MLAPPVVLQRSGGRKPLDGRDPTRVADLLALVFNLSSQEHTAALPVETGRVLDGHGLLAGHIEGNQARLPAYGSLFACAGRA